MGLMNLKLCLVVSDVSSFNSLYRGQLEFLAEQGVSLTLICGGSEEGFKTLRDRNVGDVYDLGIKRRPNVYSDVVAFFRLFFHFLIHRYDLVLVTTPKAILLGSIASLFAAQRRRVVFFQGRVYENFFGWKRKLFLFMDQLAIHSAHESIFVSRSLLEKYLEDFPSAEHKCSVIGGGSGNGVSTQRFNPEKFSLETKLEIRSSIGLSNDDFVVLSVGRICKDKGILDLVDVVESLKEFKNIKFVLLGGVDDEVARDILSKLTDSGQVIHVGYVEDVAAYMAMSDLHLFLSHREGFGNVAIEAAAMGLPTIGYDVVGLKDSINQNVSGYRYPLGEVESIIEKVLQLVSEKNKGNEHGQSARHWVIENFASDTVWKNYLNFYSRRD
jgi:glycosyltransferase involved in cell wall biosynthesis